MPVMPGNNVRGGNPEVQAVHQYSMSAIYLLQRNNHSFSYSGIQTAVCQQPGDQVKRKAGLKSRAHQIIMKL